MFNYLHSGMFIILFKLKDIKKMLKYMKFLKLIFLFNIESACNETCVTICGILFYLIYLMHTPIRFMHET